MENPDYAAALHSAPRRRREYSAAGRLVQRQKSVANAVKRTADASVNDREILENIRAGVLLIDVATRFEMSRSAVWRALRRQGFTQDLRSLNSGYGRR